MSKWTTPDRRYRKGYRMTPHGQRMIAGWVAFVVVWLTLASVFNGAGLIGLLCLVAYGSLSLFRAGQRRAVTREPPPALPWPTLPPPILPPLAPAPLGERNKRSIPQDVKIAVAVRDGGRCRQCGSKESLHYDHVIPWSKGGAGTVLNIQLLCGLCNRRKGADDIPM